MVRKCQMLDMGTGWVGRALALPHELFTTFPKAGTCAGVCVPYLRYAKRGWANVYRADLLAR
jgi:hypothetical protein